MADQGWLDINEADQDWQRKMVLDYYDVEFTDRFDNNCGYYIYSESTRDGYEVYVASESVRNVCICEDVYYYDSDLHDALADAIKDELSPIYLDDEDAELVVSKLIAKQQEYDEQFHIDLQETMSDGFGNARRVSEEELLLSEIAKLMTLLSTYESKEQYEKAAIVKNKLDQLKDKLDEL